MREETKRSRRGTALGMIRGTAMGVILAVMILALALAGCGGTEDDATDATSGGSGGSTVGGPASAPTKEGPSTLITPQQLAEMLQNKDFLMINVHIPYEGEIEPTDLFLPYDLAAQSIDQLPADKDARIVVYCRSDRMSGIAVEEWVKAGYTNLYDLDGGFVAWEEAGYPLAQKPQ